MLWEQQVQLTQEVEVEVVVEQVEEQEAPAVQES